MFINYFDLGMYDGKQTKWMVDEIFCSLKIENYNVHGFEPNRDSYLKVKDKFKDDDRIHIINRAIADNNKKTLLYHGFRKNERRPNADSIFYDKRNVKSNSTEEIECVLFSDWVLKNVSNFKTSFNIMKFNIEGAEWYLINDLVNSGLHKYIDIYCGATPDIKKIPSLAGSLHTYEKMLSDNNIKILWFAASSTSNEKETIFNMKHNIKKLRR